MRFGNGGSGSGDFGLRRLFAIVAAFAICAFAVTEAYAKASRGLSSGSRGERSFVQPPKTNTAPKPAAPIERSVAPAPAAPSPAARPAVPAAAPAAQTGIFNRPGLMGGLVAGFLGAGLFGLLAGQGLFGNLGSLSAIFGFLVQVLLIVGAVWLVLRLLRGRAQPALAGAGAPVARDAMGVPPGGGAAAQRAASGRAGHDGIGLTPHDFDAFEGLLGTIQTAYGKADLATLRRHATAEMAGYFEADLADDAARGRVNEVRDVKLLQGDLSEAWREGPTDYATVAMRFSLVDLYRDRTTGRIVDGTQEPTEATELWTFRRDHGRDWMLSAIQPA